jgi:predicted phage tail component-like protein
MSYDIRNGVKFGDKHSYTDFGLILKERPNTNMPRPKTQYVDIPGTDGSIDMTNAFGTVKYEDRNLQFKFKVIGDRENWYTRHSELANYLHGQQMKIIIDEDNKYYYLGRPQVNEWASSGNTSTIVIDAQCEPFKYDINQPADGGWLWDPFSFVDGVVFKDKMPIDGTQSLKVRIDNVPQIPTFTCDSSGMSVTFNDVTYPLEEGLNKIFEIELVKGDNILYFHGHGTIKIGYKVASL